MSYFHKTKLNLEQGRNNSFLHHYVMPSNYYNTWDTEDTQSTFSHIEQGLCIRSLRDANIHTGRPLPDKTKTPPRSNTICQGEYNLRLMLEYA